MNLIKSHFSSDRSSSVLPIFLILILTGVVYANSLNNYFVNWDDPGLVLNNTAIRSLDFKNILRIFTPRAGQTYQPVRVLSYAMDYHLWKLNPVGYHAVNILLHAVSAVFLYLVLVKVLNEIRRNRSEASNKLVGLVSAIFFVVHPVNVESVAWISSRKYGLLVFFSFLSLYFFIKNSETKPKRILWYTSSMAAYALSLLSSPVSVTLVGIFFLYDYCCSTGKGIIEALKSRFLCYVPFGLMSTLYFAIQWNVLTSGSEPSVKAHHMGNPVHTLLTMLQVLFDYIKNLMFPFWLNNLYPVRVPISFIEAKVMVSVGLLIVLIGFLLIKIRQGEKLSLFCVGWFFVTLAPVLNIIPISTKMADRYLYLPAIGMFLWISSGLYDLLVRKKPRVRWLPVFLGLVITIVFTFSILTFQRNKVWKNGETLWTDSLEKDPVNSIAQNNLGNVLARKGEIKLAIDHFNKALQIMPYQADYHNNLANALYHQGEFDEAISHYHRALEIRPSLPNVHLHIANILVDQGKLKEAIHSLSEQIRINPDHKLAKHNMEYLRRVVANKGKPNKTPMQTAEGLYINNQKAETYYHMGVKLAKQGNLKEAAENYYKALELNPNLAFAHYNLGNALAQQGKIEDAVRHFSEAVRIKPDFSSARRNLETAKSMLGKTQ